MSPAGVTAIVALESGRVFVTMFPASPGERYRGKAVAIDAPGPADQPEVGIDASGRATVVWASPPRMGVAAPGFERQAYAVTVGPDGVAGPVQALGEPGECDASLDVNLRGDAVVTLNCSATDDVVFHRPAGGSFGPAERPFPGLGMIQAGIDGRGTIHVVEAVGTAHGKYSESVTYRLAYASRPAGGGFSAPDAISRPDGVVVPPDVEVQENGRVIAGWVNADGRFVFGVRASGGSFGVSAVPAVARVAERDDGVFYGPDVVASPNGPVLLVSSEGAGASGRVVATMLGADGELTSVFRGVAGPFPLLTATPAFAVNDAGQVAGAWEQLCSYPDGGLAVMAVQRDLGGTPREPPCQDRRPPRAIAVRKRASLDGRVLRARVACNETCHLTASARVLRAGKGKPLATARTGRERRLVARRGAWLRLRLSASEVRRIVRAKRARKQVTLRLSVSVRDAYGNGRRWRLRLPVGR
jgi:hypothetical protein